MKPIPNILYELAQHSDYDVLRQLTVLLTEQNYWRLHGVPVCLWQYARVEKDARERYRTTVVDRHAFAELRLRPDLIPLSGYDGIMGETTARVRLGVLEIDQPRVLKLLEVVRGT